MDNALNGLFDAIVNDYERQRSKSEYFDPRDVEEFFSNLHVEEGRKYLKVVKQLGNQKWSGVSSSKMTTRSSVQVIS